MLAAITEQTGNKIVGPQDAAGAALPDPTLKIDLEKTPFWQALDQVLDQAGLSAYPFGDQKAIVLQPRLPGQALRSAAASYRGPFRFEAVEVQSKRDLRNPVNKALAVKIEAAWEPRLAPIALEEPLKKVVALDDAGRPMAVVGTEGTRENDVTAESMAKLLTVPLRCRRGTSAASRGWRARSRRSCRARSRPSASRTSIRPRTWSSGWPA